MIYRHGFFSLNSDSQIVNDISGNELRIIGDAYTLLLVLCEKRTILMEEAEDVLGFDKSYHGRKIEEDIEKINHAIGKEIIFIEQVEDEFDENTILSLKGELVVEG